MADAKLTFVTNIITSKIFWVQVVTLVAMVASAAGYKVLDAPGVQEQLVGALDAFATIILRLWFPSGPVSITGPLTSPTPKDVPPGTSIVVVPSDPSREVTVNPT